jgi:hypothetical protein
MKAIVNVVVVGTLGLAVLLGSPTVAPALPKFAAGKTYCYCNCYSKQGGTVNLSWEKIAACGIANGRACSFTSGGKKVSGTLNSCSECTGDANNQTCSFASSSAASSQQLGVVENPGGFAPTTQGQTGTAVPRAPAAPLAK